MYEKRLKDFCTHQIQYHTSNVTWNFIRAELPRVLITTYQNYYMYNYLSEFFIIFV